GRGIGRGIVLEFAREGADVAINYRRDRDAAEQTAAEARAFGRRALVVQADVGDREAVEKMVADSVAFLGALDVAVANSGVAAGVVRSDMGERLPRFQGDVILQTIPLGRAGEPAEIGRAAVFLASDDATWITGKVLRIDGGAWM